MQTSITSSTGTLLRGWRQRRGMSQLDVAAGADSSTRHVSFIETGRALPSRSLLLRLAALLEVPLRERNTLLLSAGYAPMYRESAIGDTAMASARDAIERLLMGHDPYPALVVDRHWNLLTANRAAQGLMAGLPDTLLQPTCNVLRVSLHPSGLAPRIENLAEWRAHILERLQHQHASTGDPVLAALHAELQDYPVDTADALSVPDAGSIIVPLRLRVEGGHVLSLISTTTVFGTPRDVTLAELAIESFFPADAATAALLQAAQPRHGDA